MFNVDALIGREISPAYGYGGNGGKIVGGFLDRGTLWLVCENYEGGLYQTGIEGVRLARPVIQEDAP